MQNNANPFKIAQSQFDEAASLLGLEPSLAEFMRWPMREFIFTIPVRMEDGNTRTFRGYRVQYNDARGPCSGGLRWHPDESPDAGRAQAAWMTWRTALMDLPLGGASGGLICDPKKMTDREKESLARGWMRVMAHELGDHRDVLTPDVYTNPQIMAWMLDEFEVITGRSHPAVISGKPTALGGSQGRNDATARGGVLAVREACKVAGVNPTGTYAIQGFGNAGQHAALLHQKILGGGTLIAISDTSGGVFNPNGIDPKKAIEHKMRTGKLAGLADTEPIGNEELLELDVDILYPAALENVITQENAERIKAKISCELADGPTAPEADRILHVKGVHVIPDFLANAGSITVSYLEQVQGTYNYFWTLEEIHEQLDARMTKAYEDVYKMQQEMQVPMRTAAYLLAINRVAEAVKLRGWV